MTSPCSLLEICDDAFAMTRTHFESSFAVQEKVVPSSFPPFSCCGADKPYGMAAQRERDIPEDQLKDYYTELVSDVAARETGLKSLLIVAAADSLPKHP